MNKKPQTVEQYKQTLTVPDMQHVKALFDIATFNKAARTVEVVMTTEAPALMWSWDIGYFNEILQCDKASIEAQRLNNGLPVLDNHNRYGSVKEQTLGKVIAWDCVGGQLRGTVKFSSRSDLAEFIQDVEDGIIQNLSVGYRVHTYQIDKPATETETAVYRAIKWEPLEVSFVNVGADGNATTRSATGEAPKPEDKTREVAITNAHIQTKTNTSTAMDPEEIKKQERERVNKINAAVRAAGLEASVAEKFINDGTSPEDAEKEITRLKSEKEAQPQSPEAARAAGAKEANERAAKILAAARKANLPQEDAEALIGSTKSVETCLTEIMDKFASADPNRGAQGTITVTNENHKKLSGALEDALLIRSNSLAAGKLTEQARKDAHQFVGRSIIQSVRQWFAASGTNVDMLTDKEVAQKALSTSDFANVLGNTINRSLLAAYAVAPRTFLSWTTRMSVKDFRAMKMVRLSGLMQALDKVNEGGEYKYSDLTDSGEDIFVEKFGRLIAITWEAMINDYLGAFSQIPQAIANAAATKQSDMVYQVLIGNPVMSDGNALFSAAHNNLITPGTALNATNLGVARQRLRTMKTLNGDYMNLLGQYLIVGPELETLALQYTSSEYLPNTQAEINPWKSLQVIVEPRITGNDWHLAASPNSVNTINYAFLEGESELFMESQWQFNRDIYETKARMVFGAAASDWRGLVKNEGA